MKPEAEGFPSFNCWQLAELCFALSEIECEQVFFWKSDLSCYFRMFQVVLTNIYYIFIYIYIYTCIYIYSIHALFQGHT